MVPNPIKHGMIWGYHYFWKHPYNLGCPPSQDSSHHQDYYIFSRGSQPKPSFATVAGRGDNPTYTSLFCWFLSFLYTFFRSSIFFFSTIRGTTSSHPTATGKTAVSQWETNRPQGSNPKRWVFGRRPACGVTRCNWAWAVLLAEEFSGISQKNEWFSKEIGRML